MLCNLCGSACLICRERKKVSGTCEKIGFTDFSTMYFQCFTQLITGRNSISSHVPDTLFLYVCLV